MDSDFMIPLMVFSTVIIFVGFAVTLVKRKGGRDRLKARELAVALGFDYVEGRDALAAKLGADGLDAQLAMLDKLPGFLKRLIEAGGSWRIKGQVEGISVLIYLETRSNNKSSTTYTIVRALYRGALAFDLRVAKEGFFTKMGKTLFNLEDIEVGDEAFDSLVRIKSKDTMNARLLVGTDDAKRALFNLLSAYSGAFATSSYAHWERVGLSFETSEIKAVVAALVPVAKALGA